MSRPHDTHAEFWSKFWAKVDKSGDCWLWLGVKNPSGYGRIDYRGKSYLAHRMMLFWFKRIPTLEKMRQNKTGIALHSCDNPSCVNPEHLSVGTAAENISSVYQRGRMPPRSGERGPLAKLSDSDAEYVITAVYSGVARSSLAAKYKVHRSTIDSIVLGKTFKHVFEKFHNALGA